MATLTVFPDPNVEVSSVDGVSFYFSTAVTWATIRTANGTGFNDSSASDSLLQLRAGTVSGQYDFFVKGIYLFNTSALTASAIISAATLSIFGQSKGNNLGLSDAHSALDIVSSNPASNTALANGSLQTIGTTRFSNVGTTYTAWSTVAYNDFAFNATGLAAISKTSVSKFGIKCAADLDNQTPAWVSGQGMNINGYFADQAATTNDPKLVITYTLSTVKQLAALGVG